MEGVFPLFGGHFASNSVRGKSGPGEFSTQLGPTRPGGILARNPKTRTLKKPSPAGPEFIWLWRWSVICRKIRCKFDESFTLPFRPTSSEEDFMAKRQISGNATWRSLFRFFSENILNYNKNTLYFTEFRKKSHFSSIIRSSEEGVARVTGNNIFTGTLNYRSLRMCHVYQFYDFFEEIMRKIKNT